MAQELNPALIIAPPQGKAGRTLETILVAALACYERFGIEETTLEQVAEQAGVSRATVYRHAKNRRELLNKVFVRDAQKSLAEVQANLGNYDTLAETVLESMLYLISKIGCRCSKCRHRMWRYTKR